MKQTPSPRRNFEEPRKSEISWARFFGLGSVKPKQCIDWHGSELVLGLRLVFLLDDGPAADAVHKFGEILGERIRGAGLVCGQSRMRRASSLRCDKSTSTWTTPMSSPKHCPQPPPSFPRPLRLDERRPAARLGATPVRIRVRSVGPVDTLMSTAAIIEAVVAEAGGRLLLRGAGHTVSASSCATAPSTRSSSRSRRGSRFAQSSTPPDATSCDSQTGC